MIVFTKSYFGLMSGLSKKRRRILRLQMHVGLPISPISESVLDVNRRAPTVIAWVQSEREPLIQIFFNK